MSDNEIRTLNELIGADHVPNFRRGIPAAWWTTTDPAALSAYDRWKADHAAHYEKTRALEQQLGLPEGSTLINSFAKQTSLVGFRPTKEMNLWAGHSEHAEPPPGWRIDRKKDCLVPVRRTKTDRESEANKQFAALKKMPDVAAYLTGMPEIVSLRDRAGGGGTWYSIDYRRGAECVMAFCGGDPDRSTEPTKIDTTIWQRQQLSTLLALSETVAAQKVAP